jgi:hypothetical protein
MFFQLIFDAAPTEPLRTVGFGAAGYGIALFIGLIVVAIILLILTRSMRRPEMYGMTPARVKELWKQIEQTGKQGIMGAKLAVMEADKLLDGVLKSMMMPGDTMAERLKAAQYKYPNLQKVWWAHKLRNQFAHDSSSEITQRQAATALKDFESALKTLKVL